MATTPVLPSLGQAREVFGAVEVSGGNSAAATSTAVASGTGDVQGVAAATSLRFLGFTCRENAGTPATAEFILRHGTDNTGTPLAFVKLAAGESVREWSGPDGVAAASGIFVDRVSGTTEITLFTKVAA